MKFCKSYLLLGLATASLASCGSPETDTSGSDPSPPPLTAPGNVPSSTENSDALVAGTDYNATTILDCGFDGAPPTQDCNAGVKRNWGEEPGGALVEVTKPDGTKRAIFFRGTEPYGADSAQADGSADWDFSSSREGDRVTIKFGPETYVVVDAMIEGG